MSKANNVLIDISKYHEVEEAIESISNNIHFPGKSNIINAILKEIFTTEGGLDLKINLDSFSGEKTIKELIKSGDQTVRIHFLNDYTRNNRGISKEFKENFYSLDLETKKHLEIFLKNTIKLIESKNHEVTIGTAKNLSLYIDSEHALYVKFEKGSIILSDKMHTNRADGQMENNFLWNKILRILSKDKTLFEVSGKDYNIYTVTNEGLTLLAKDILA